MNEGGGIAELIVANIEVRAHDLTAGAFSSVRGGLTGLSGVASMAGKAFALLPIAAAAAAAGAIAASVKLAADWNHSMDLIRNNTGMTAKQIRQVADESRAMAREGPIGAQEIAQGFEHLANLGYKGAAAAHVMHIAWKAAIATGGNAADTANTLGTAMKNFGIHTSGAARAMNILASAAAAGNLRLPDLLSHFSKLSIIASSLKMPLSSAAALMSTLTKATGDAALAQTYASNMLMHMAHMTKQASDEAAVLKQRTGVDLVAAFKAFAAGHMSLQHVMELTRTATKGNSDALSLLFGGLRGGVGAMALLGKHWKDFNETLGKTEHPIVNVESGFKRMQQTVGFALGQIKNNILDIGISIGSKLLPILSKAAQEVVKFVTELEHNKTALQALHQIANALGGILHQLGNILGQLGAALFGTGEHAKTLHGHFVALNGASRDAASAHEHHATAAQKVASALKNIASALSSASAELKKWNTELKSGTGPLTKIASALHDFRAAANDLNTALKSLSKTFGGKGDKGSAIGAAEIFGAVLDVLLRPTYEFAQLLHALAAGIKLLASAIANVRPQLAFLHDVIKRILDIPGDAFDWGVNLIKGLIRGISSMAGPAKSAAEHVLSGIKHFLGFGSPNPAGDDPHKWGASLIRDFGSGVASGTSAITAALASALDNWQALIDRKHLRVHVDASGGGGGSAVSQAKQTMSGDLKQFIAAVGKLPRDLQGALASTIAQYKQQIQALNAKYIADIKAENESYHQKLKNNDAASVDARRRNDDSYNAARKRADESFNAARKSADQSYDAARKSSAASEHATLRQYAADQKSSYKQHVSDLRHAFDEYKKGNADHIREWEKKLRAAEKDGNAKKEAADKQHIAELKKALAQHAADLKRHLNEAAEKLHQHLQNHASRIEAANNRHAANIARSHGQHSTAIAKAHAQHQAAIAKAHAQHAAAIAKAHADHARQIVAAHKAHVAQLQAAFGKHAAQIEAALKKLSAPAGLWDKLKSQIDSMAEGSMKALDLAFLEHAKNLKSVGAVAVKAADAVNKMADAARKAEEYVKSHSKSFTDRIDAAGMKVEDLTNKAASEIMKTGQVSAATAAALQKAASASDLFSKALDQAKSIIKASADVVKTTAMDQAQALASSTRAALENAVASHAAASTIAALGSAAKSAADALSAIQSQVENILNPKSPEKASSGSADTAGATNSAGNGPLGDGRTGSEIIADARFDRASAGLYPGQIPVRPTKSSDLIGHRNLDVNGNEVSDPNSSASGGGDGPPEGAPYSSTKPSATSSGGAEGGDAYAYLKTTAADLQSKLEEWTKLYADSASSLDHASMLVAFAQKAIAGGTTTQLQGYLQQFESQKVLGIATVDELQKVITGGETGAQLLEAARSEIVSSLEGIENQYKNDPSKGLDFRKDPEYQKELSLLESIDANTANTAKAVSSPEQNAEVVKWLKQLFELRKVQGGRGDLAGRDSFWQWVNGLNFSGIPMLSQS